MVGRPIYLDNHATTQVDPRVVEGMVHTMLHAFGNPQSTEHLHGAEAAALVEVAREHVGRLVGSSARSVHFTSGASDALAWALIDAVRQVGGSRRLRVIATPTEHRAVLTPLDELTHTDRAWVRMARVDRNGRVDLSHLEELLDAGADLVCVMAANNEIGTLTPIPLVADLCQAAGAHLLVDATQAAGRVPIAQSDWGITYLALSAHKMHGPKGTGALVSDIVTDTRQGTPNVPGIVGFGEACRLRRLEMVDDERRIAAMRDLLQARLEAGLPDLVVNGDQAARLAGNLHVAIPGIPADALVARLAPHVTLSTGAACSSGSDAPSHVLLAIDMPWDLTDSSLRIGIGRFNTRDDVEQAAHHILTAVTAIRSMM